MLYPQNGDRIVAIDSVTSLHPVYNQAIMAVSVAATRRDAPSSRMVTTTPAPVMFLAQTGITCKSSLGVNVVGRESNYTSPAAPAISVYQRTRTRFICSIHVTYICNDRQIKKHVSFFFVIADLENQLTGCHIVINSLTDRLID